MATKPVSMKKRVAELLEARTTARLGGGEKRIEKQHAAGKASALDE